MKRMLFDRLLRRAKPATLFTLGAAVSVLFSMPGNDDGSIVAELISARVRNQPLLLGR